MANTKRNLMGAAAVVMTLWNASQAMAADGSIKTLVLRVDNYAQVSDEVLGDAEKVASSIYAAAGVRTIWVAGASETACTDPSVACLRVVILNAEMAEKKIAAEKIDNNVLGRAAGPTKRAYIFYHRIDAVATTKQAIVNDLLGKVMAHEVGHLVLTPGHSDRGIMRAELDLRPTAAQRFTTDQVAAIRTYLAAATQAN